MLAATATLAIVVAIVIVTLIFLAASLASEASSVYERIRSGEVTFGRYFRQMLDALPSWAPSVLERVGLDDGGSVQSRLSGERRAGEPPGSLRGVPELSEARYRRRAALRSRG